MKNKIYCAIDTPDLAIAVKMAGMIGPVTGTLKLGLEFFNANGPQGVAEVQKAVPDCGLFLDLKYHDIPNTVSSAIAAVTKTVQPAYLNVHCSGGLEMMRAARGACPDGTKLLGVTILTSLDEDGMNAVGFPGSPRENALRLAQLAQKAGLDGVVCSAHEIEAIREACGPDLELMVPGIRPEGAAADDQKRIMTPREAIDKGATHLVIGRPITKADDPAAAAKDILQSLQGA